MELISEYIKRPIEVRRSHLKLGEPCIERGGFSTKFTGILAVFLDTSIPERKSDKVHVYLCHACKNERCSNPVHLYWGTPKDNYLDGHKNGNFSSAWDATVKKYGIDTALKMARTHQLRIAGLGGAKSKGRKMSKELWERTLGRRWPKHEDQSQIR